MQLHYSQGPIPAIPGQLYDLNSVGRGDIISRVAGAIIPPGVYCELNSSGLLVPAKDLTASWPPALGFGVSIYDLAGFEQGYFPFAVPPTTAGSIGLGYQIGQVVPVLKSGRIWMAYDGGGTPVKLGVGANMWHSSDGTHAQGVITFSATSATVGAEIGAVPASMTVWNPDLLAAAYTDGFGVSAGICAMNI
jgi:hypothetical protein